jgi:hypothetical protein
LPPNVSFNHQVFLMIRKAMKNIRFIIPVLFIAGSGLSGLKAQNTMIVKEAGKQTSYALKSIKKLTFAGGEMMVTQTGGNFTNYVLSSVSLLDFISVSTDIPHPGIQKSTFFLYPVPVNDQLHIRYGEKKGGIVQVEIADMQGRIVFRQVIHEQAGNGEEIINLAQLAKGLYLCRLQNGDQIETCSFLKE